MNKAKPHPDHICRSNDGKQNCECFTDGHKKGYVAGTDFMMKQVQEAEARGIQKCIEALEEEIKGDNTIPMAGLRALNDMIPKLKSLLPQSVTKE